MLKKFKIEDCKPMSTPMITSCKLSKEDESKEVDQRLYRSIIGSLLYVTTSRPYMMQDVRQVARFQDIPKETHIIAVKRIFRYLKGTMDFGLRYPQRNELKLIAYLNTNWVGCVNNRRSIIGTTVFSRQLSSILVEQKTIFTILINRRSRIYSNNNLLDSDSLDETNSARHTLDM